MQAYLTRFAASVQAFVKAHPGLTPYVIRRLAATEAMIDKINDHQAHIAQAYGLSLEQARWLLSTVAFHGFAVADTVSGREPLLEADRAGEESEMEVELLEGMQALPVLGQAPDISTPRYFFANPAEVPPALYTAPDISQGNVPHMEYLEWAACRMAMLPVKPGVVSHCNG